MKCIHCKTAENLILLQCHHSICFDCVYSEYQNKIGIPFCCGSEIKFSLLFEYLDECDMQNCFPQFLDTKISYKQRIDSSLSEENPRPRGFRDIYFRGLHFRSQNQRYFYTHFGRWRYSHPSTIYDKFHELKLPLSYVTVLSKELYHIYVVYKDHSFFVSFRNNPSEPQETEKFLVHYHRLGILFEYTCHKVEQNDYYYDIYYVNYVFTISQIMKNISTEYIQEKFRGNIMTFNENSRSRLQLLNRNSIVHIPEKYRDLRYYIYNNYNYSNNEKKFQNFRYIHFTDMAVIEKKYQNRRIFLLLFYKSKAKKINSYDIRREIFSFLEL
jgi:hypothetical protein